MNQLTLCGCVSALLLLAALPSHAQNVAPTPAAAAKADARDARARVPAVTHVSPLATYRALGDAKMRPWREANDEVERIGGWRTYLREASSADAPASAPTPSGGGQAVHQHAPRPNPSK